MADQPKRPEGVNPKTFDIRTEYEKNIPSKEAGEGAHRKHWHKYMQDMGKADPTVKLYPDQWKNAFPEKYPEYGEPKAPSYAKGGQVGKVNPFGLHRSKPDFAGGGPKTNFKMNTKKGKMPW